VAARAINPLWTTSGRHRQPAHTWGVAGTLRRTRAGLSSRLHTSPTGRPVGDGAALAGPGDVTAARACDGAD
jgi:hypothetical protein